MSYRAMNTRPREQTLTLIAIALTFGSGAADVASFTRLGFVFTSVMTGNIVLLGLAVARGSLTLASHTVVSIGGYIVGVASDWPRSSQQPLWSRHGVEPEFVGGKHHLHEVKAQFPADRYVHVGDTDVDERYALLAGFEFLHVDQLVEPVVADDIHDAAWRAEP